MFGDYYYNVENHTQSLKTVNGFDYRRIYLTTDYNISDGFAARFRLESDPSASDLGTTTIGPAKSPNDTTGNTNGKLTVMVKDAYLDWKSLIPNGHVIFGLQGTPDINMAEGIFGYRSLEKTIQDLHSVSASRDLGISASDKFSDAITAGILIGNNNSNSGNFAPNFGKYKRGYLYFQIKPMNELTILLDGDYFSQFTTGLENYGKTGDVIVNYVTTSFSIGVQGFMQGVDHKGTNGLGASNNSTLVQEGVSINGWVELIDNLRLVARFDNWNPNTSAHTSVTGSAQNFLLGALDWSVAKNVHIMPNFEYTHYSVYNTKGDPNDIVGRATFYFTF
jgi:hypothetical protein